MVLPGATLDHVVVNARDDLDMAQETYRRLGFRLTERGYHSMGSMNHLAIFGTDYLELIAVPPGGNSPRRDLLIYPVGLNGLVFGSEDAAATFELLEKNACPFERPVEFSRPVIIAGELEEAKFRGIFMKPNTVPYGRVYFCQHLTRQFVWRDECRKHDNGVVAVQRMVIVEEDPRRALELYAKMFGADAVRDSDSGRTVVLGNSRVDIITEQALRDSFGPGAPESLGRKGYMAALTLRTVSLSKAKKLFAANGITNVDERNQALVVPARHALNVTLEFVE
jgi:catechol 2,3-dioxygenase-like lactoylglutathione lyase family enzyme